MKVCEPTCSGEDDIGKEGATQRITTCNLAQCQLDEDTYKEDQCR